MAEGHVLAVDDEPNYLRLIRFNLEAEGYRVSCVETGEEALAALGRQALDLVMLDIMLPGLDGFQVCSTICEVSSVPIIMLTAKGANEDKVKGLRLGADDYVVKPFSAQELLARVEAVLRRVRQPAFPGKDASFALDDLRIDLLTRKVTIGGQDVHPSPTEYMLLAYLASNSGRTVTQDEILKNVWGPGYEREHEVVRVTMWRLRQKLGDSPSEPRFITTVPGVGYLFGDSA